MDADDKTKQEPRLLHPALVQKAYVQFVDKAIKRHDLMKRNAENRKLKLETAIPPRASSVVVSMTTTGALHDALHHSRGVPAPAGPGPGHAAQWPPHAQMYHQATPQYDMQQMYRQQQQQQQQQQQEVMRYGPGPGSGLGGPGTGPPPQSYNYEAPYPYQAVRHGEYPVSQASHAPSYQELRPADGYAKRYPPQQEQVLYPPPPPPPQRLEAQPTPHHQHSNHDSRLALPGGRQSAFKHPVIVQHGRADDLRPAASPGPLLNPQHASAVQANHYPPPATPQYAAHRGPYPASQAYPQQVTHLETHHQRPPTSANLTVNSHGPQINTGYSSNSSRGHYAQYPYHLNNQPTVSDTRATTYTDHNPYQKPHSVIQRYPPQLQDSRVWTEPVRNPAEMQVPAFRQNVSQLPSMSADQTPRPEVAHPQVVPRSLPPPTPSTVTPTQVPDVASASSQDPLRSQPVPVAMTGRPRSVADGCEQPSNKKRCLTVLDQVQATPKLKHTVPPDRRESPVDLSVRTVRRSADSTARDDHPGANGQGPWSRPPVAVVPRIDFVPNFGAVENVMERASPARAPSRTATPVSAPTSVLPPYSSNTSTLYPSRCTFRGTLPTPNFGSFPALIEMHIEQRLREAASEIGARNAASTSPAEPTISPRPEASSTLTPPPMVSSSTGPASANQMAEKRFRTKGEMKMMFMPTDSAEVNNQPAAVAATVAEEPGPSPIEPSPEMATKVLPESQSLPNATAVQPQAADPVVDNNNEENKEADFWDKFMDELETGKIQGSLRSKPTKKRLLSVDGDQNSNSGDAAVKLELADVNESNDVKQISDNSSKSSNSVSRARPKREAKVVPDAKAKQVSSKSVANHNDAKQLIRKVTKSNNNAQSPVKQGPAARLRESRAQRLARRTSSRVKLRNKRFLSSSESETSDGAETESETESESDSEPEPASRRLTRQVSMLSKSKSSSPEPENTPRVTRSQDKDSKKPTAKSSEVKLTRQNSRNASNNSSSSPSKNVKQNNKSPSKSSPVKDNKMKGKDVAESIKSDQLKNYNKNGKISKLNNSVVKEEIEKIPNCSKRCVKDKSVASNSQAESDDTETVARRLRARGEKKEGSKLAPNELQPQPIPFYKKPSFGDGSDFRPGWEEEVFQYKRSLRMPQILIAVSRAGSSTDLDRCNSPCPSVNTDLTRFGSDIDSTSNGQVNDFEENTSSSILSSSTIRTRSPRKQAIFDQLVEKVALRSGRSSQMSRSKSKDSVFKYKGFDGTKPVTNFKDAFRLNGILQDSNSRTKKKGKQEEIEENSIMRSVFGDTKQQKQENKSAESQKPKDPPTKIRSSASKKTKERRVKSTGEGIVLRPRGNAVRGRPGLRSAALIRRSKVVLNTKQKKTRNLSVPPVRPAEEGFPKNDGDKPSLVLKKKIKLRRKFRSGFDYIRKKKKAPPKGSSSASIAKAKPKAVDRRPMTEDEIQSMIRNWVINRSHGDTVLHRATRTAHPDVVKYAVQTLGLSPSVPDNAGFTPLHEASRLGHLEIARILLELGADVSSSAQGGIRPLHEASVTNNTEMMRLLLSYGADPTLATYGDQTPISETEPDSEAHLFLRHHLADIDGSPAPAWRYLGPSRIFDERRQSADLALQSPPAFSDSESEIEIVSSETLPPPLHTFHGESCMRYWVLVSDLMKILQAQSEDTLLNMLNACSNVDQISSDEKTESRQMLLEDFLAKTKRITFLLSEENLPPPGTMVLLLEYNDKVKNLLNEEMSKIPSR